MRISDWSSDVCSSDLDVTAIAFRGYILAERCNGFARNHLAANSRLNRNFEQVAGNQILQPLAHMPPARFGCNPMDNHGQRVHGLCIQEDVHLDQITLTRSEEQTSELQSLMSNTY